MSTLADWVRIPDTERPLAAAPARTQPVGRTRHLSWGIGIAAALLYALGGIWMTMQFGVMGDSMSRVGNAYYVLFSRDPHLEAIGFVWNPLPSLLAIPLVALHDLWPGLVREGIAAVLISAVFGGIALVYMQRIVKRFGLTEGQAWGIALLFAVNPFIAYYAANGMTEIIMIAALLGALDGLWHYLETRHLSGLVVSACWVGAGFLVRYEVAVWALATAAVLAIGFARLPAYVVRTQRDRGRIAGRLIIWLAPFTWAMASWLFFNWIIMKDPLYFLHSAYSNEGQLSTGAYAYDPVTAAFHSMTGTLSFVGYQLLLFAPVYLGIIGLAYFSLRGNPESKLRSQLLLVGLLSIPVLQAYMLFAGSSAGWLRYFVVAILFGFLSLAFTFARPPFRRASTTAFAICVGLLLLGNAGTYLVMTSHESFRTTPLMSFDEADHVVAYLNAHPDDTIIVDSFRGYPIIMRVDDPTQLVISSDRDFKELLNSRSGDVDAILVPSPVGPGAVDAVNRRYPGLWAGEVSWARLVREFPGEDRWRLYAIHEDAAQGVNLGDSTGAPSR